MIKNASSFGADSTASNDKRITPIGHLIRKFKLDELTQLLNVFLGQMSLVGPRPNVLSETKLYTNEERRILTVKPGITDFASIVFSDEGEILAGKSDPDLAYNQLIRPWKSRLAILYTNLSSFRIDLTLILVTIVSLFSREKALKMIVRLLTKLHAENELITISSRKIKLTPYPPPGSDKIVTTRETPNI
jgi:lipopolysaccharide/colanic/teichoic acid biosynthesis glycosyltransferase